MATPAAPSADQDWWVAELDVPFEAVAVNFVINYYEYYDNNGLQDYKLLVGAYFEFEFELKTSLSRQAGLAKACYQIAYTGRQLAAGALLRGLQAHRVQKLSVVPLPIPYYMQIKTCSVQT